MTPTARHIQLKPSGAAWLGNVPAHWDVKPLWAMYRPKKSTGHPLETLLSVYRDHGVIEKSSREDNKNRASEDLSGYQLVVNGDLVTNKMKTWQGSIAISSLQGIVSPAYYVYGKQHSGNDTYFHHLFRSTPYITGYQSISKGIRVGQWDLEADKFRLFPVIVPPPAEQDAIVAHLDRATSRIDALVAKKSRFIELLREKRQATITHAVTKGLDKNVPMKDSGIDWLGKVPAHWMIAPLKRLVHFQRGHDLPAEHRRSGNIPIISSGGAIGFHSAAAARGPGIVTGRYGSIGQFTFVDEDYWPLNTALYSTDLCGNEPRLVWYLLHSLSDLFVMESNKSAVPGIDRNDIHEILVAHPPQSEQRAIVAHLDRATGRIDALIAKSERSIELLREHRTALITAAVTGKIDLRSAA